MKVALRKCHLVLAFFFVMALLAGCGGVPEGYVDESVEADSTQASGNVDQQNNYGSANQAVVASQAAINAGAITSSFTLNSTQDFRGFNPEIWNDKKSWYECNCGNDLPELPRKMPWNPPS